MTESIARPALLSNDRLLSSLKQWVTEESRLLTEILEHLREVESRQLFLERGYPSLFAFATIELKYSEGAAQRRISAMRLLKVLPEFKEKIACGDLSLTNAAQAQGFIRRENMKRKEVGMGKLDRQAQREIVTEVLGKSKAQAERVLVNRLPQGEPPREFIRALRDDRSLIQFLASADLARKLDKLKGLLAHQLGDGSFEGLIDRLAEIALDRVDPEPLPAEVCGADLPPPVEVIGAGSPPPAAEVARAGTRRSRSPFAADRRTVWIRDGGKCTFHDEITGRVCGSRHALQYDHIVPYAMGGPTTAENLALRCAAHNRFRAERAGLRRSGRARA